MSNIKKMPVRILSLLIALMVCFGGLSVTVSAATGDKVTIDLCKAYDSDGKLITWKSNVAAGSKGQPIYRIYTMSGNTKKDAYCLQPGSHLNYNDVLTENTSAGAWAKLTDSQRKAIAYAMTFGKDGNSSKLVGNYDEKWTATAIVVWEIVEGCRNADSKHLECTNNMYRNAGSTTGSNIRKNYEIIDEGLYNASVIPSFTNSQKGNAPSINLSWDSSSKKWTGSITDKNKVLSNFSYAGTYSMGSYKLTVTQSGNNLSFSCNAPSTATLNSDTIGSKNVKFPTGGSTTNIVAYSDSTLQDCVGSGSADPPSAYFKIHTPGTEGNDFYIQKEVWTEAEYNSDLMESSVGSAETLSGWYFSVTNSKTGFSAIVGPTDDLGQTKKISSYSSTPVYDGSYTVTELGRLTSGKSGKSTSDFYMPSNYTPGFTNYEYTLGQDVSSGTSVVRMVGYLNYIDMPSLRIIKSSDNGDVEGFYFKVHNKDNPSDSFVMGPTGSKGSTTKKIPDSFGIIGTTMVIEELGNKNADGTYSIPPEFEQPDPIELTLEADYFTDGSTISVTFYNICMGKFTIQKSDKTNGKALAGATYSVYNSDATDSEGKLLDYAYVGDLTTGEDGTATSDKLPLGTYYLQEKEAPINYELDENVYSVTLTAGSNINPVVIELKDTPAKGNIKITKTDTDKNEPVSGAIYGIYSSNKTDKDGMILSEALVEKLTTDKNGSAISGDLLFNTYYIQEISAPDGYTVSKEIYPVDVNDSYTDNLVEVYVKDSPTKVHFTKTDITGDNEVVGAFLQVIDSKGKVVDEWTSTTEPHAIEGKLVAGEKYTLHEVSSPDGYVVTSDITFTVNTDGSILSVNMKDDTTKVKFLKTDLSGKNTVSGAVLQVIDNKGKVVYEWTTTTQPYVINGKLIAGATYILHEVSAPLGYVLADDIIFTVGTTGDIKTVSMTDDTTKVQFAKTDLNGNLISGAELQLLDNNGKVVDNWISSNEGYHTIIGKLGARETYTLHEVSAPSGYVIADDISFTVGTDGEMQTVTMFDDTTKVEFIKTDLSGENAVTGTVLQVIDSEGNIIDEWETTEDAYVLDGKLVAGATYTLHEVSAPSGYVLADDITFTVGTNGEMQTVTMADDTTKVEFIKTDLSGENAVTGTVLQVIDSEGNIIDEWETTEDAYVLDGKLVAGATYTLHEVSAPSGYVLADDITFTVGIDGELQTLTMFDDTTKVEFFKTDLSGENAVTGAVLQVIDSEGNIIDEWETTEDAYVLDGKLIAGATYTLHEVSAPTGYVLADDITFTVGTDGEMQTVTMADDTTKVTVEKLSSVDNSPLSGAKLQLLDKDGNVIDEWETTDEGHTFTGILVAGETYTVHEVSAPDGYSLAEDIEFVVNDNGDEQVITMTDEYTGYATIATPDQTPSQTINATANGVVQTGDGNTIAVVLLITLIVATFFAIAMYKRRNSIK